ncbi:hypothetical protein UlMin_046208 [Ulmus minor]
MDPDEELAIIILVMYYFYRKLRSASRVPQQVSNFSGHNRMIDLLHGNDRRFVDILRMPKSCFVRLCDLLQQHGVRNTRSLSVEEQVMMFLLVVGHGDSTRRSGYEWHHSTETVSRHFNNICFRIVGLAPQLIGPPDFNNIPPLIANNSRYFPYFRDCVGAIDGTHIPCIVDAHLQPAYRNRKGYTTGWEGSVHDARVLREAMSDPAFSFPTPPGEKYFLVDAGYANRRGFLSPYRGTNYYLRDRTRLGGDRKKELFNYRHASLRNAVERTFGIWKSRFRILRGVPHYPLRTQRDIIIACAVLHNFLMMSDDVDVSVTAEEDAHDEDDMDQGGDTIGQDAAPSTQQEEGHQTEMGRFRDTLTESMWVCRNQN